MKILFLAPQPFFETRGTPINVRLVVSALSDLGHTVDLVVYPHGKDEVIPNVTIERVVKIPGLGKAPIGPSKSKIAYDMAMFAKVTRLLLFRRYDVIHAVEESAFMAWILSKVFSIPYIFDMDSHITDQLRYSGFLNDGPLLRLVERLESAALKSSRVVVTVCPYLTGVASRYVEPGKVHQVEDIPIDLPPPPTSMTPATLRAELGISDSELVALYTGNLEKYQGMGLLMESIPEVVKSFPSVRFVIVGGDDRPVEAYRAMAKELGVGGHVLFTGPRPMGHMPVFHELADILLSPRVEGTNTPLKIYTYLDTGKPIVATDLPTHTQLLNPNVAVLARPEIMEYSSAILLLLKSEDLREKLGAAGKKMVALNYNYELFRNKIDKAYKNL